MNFHVIGILESISIDFRWIYLPSLHFRTNFIESCWAEIKVMHGTSHAPIPNRDRNTAGG
jgi:hypothetical protein